MTRVIDISTPVDGLLPAWPGSPGASFATLLSIARGDDANATAMTADLHTGTHIDAPLHFVEGGADVEALGLSALIGPALVVDVGDAKSIGPEELSASTIPDETRRLLLRTNNTRDRLLRHPDFEAGAVALTAEGARWVVDRGIELVGIDYLSIQSVHDGPETHQILLQARVVILEGLDLESAPAGNSDLICLPMRLVDREAAPARAVLVPSGTI